MVLLHRLTTPLKVTAVPVAQFADIGVVEVLSCEVSAAGKAGVVGQVGEHRFPWRMSWAAVTSFGSDVSMRSAERIERKIRGRVPTSRRHPHPQWRATAGEAQLNTDGAVFLILIKIRT